MHEYRFLEVSVGYPGIGITDGNKLSYTAAEDPIHTLWKSILLTPEPFLQLYFVLFLIFFFQSGFLCVSLAILELAL